MYIHMPKSWNGLVVVADIRNKVDRELDLEKGGTHVLTHWPMGKAALGADWQRTARIALFDHGENLGIDETLRGKERGAARAKANSWKHMQKAELRRWLDANKPAMTVFLQTRSQQARANRDYDDGEVLGADGTICWALAEAPDSLPNAAGCLVNAPWSPAMGVLNPINYEWVYGEVIASWLQRAHGFAKGRLKQPWYESHIHPGPAMTDALKRLLAVHSGGAPLSVDIESFTDGSVITAVGFAAGSVAVSVPWENYQPYGQSEAVFAADSSTLGLARRLLEVPHAKILHNGIAYDGPLLASRGYRMNGPIQDTYLLHGLVHNQLRHGLQQAVSYETLCPAWKSAHKPLGLKKTDPAFWQADPEGLRRYNCSDAFFTAKLFDTLSWKAGLNARQF